MDVNVEITHLSNKLVDGSTKLKCVCSFCEKQVIIHNADRLRNLLITQPKGKGSDFFCNFCIKNNLYHQPYSKQVLILSFRGIIGFYYYCLYRIQTPIIYANELKSYIELHEIIGNCNPIFLYDPESYCWFVDFAKIDKKNFTLKYTLETILEILAGFNLYSYFPKIKGHVLFEKYQDAILDFYKTKIRPGQGRKILSPTLIECDATFLTDAKDVSLAMTRNFIPQNFIYLDKFK